MLGLPTEGEIGDRMRVLGYLQPVRTVGIDMTIADARGLQEMAGPIAVVGSGGVLLGSLDPLSLRLPADTIVEAAMIRAPGTIRPDMRLDDALKQLHDDGLAFTHVTTARGEVLGLLFADAHV